LLLLLSPSSAIAIEADSIGVYWIELYQINSLGLLVITKGIALALSESTAEIKSSRYKSQSQVRRCGVLCLEGITGIGRINCYFESRIVQLE
jgi:hypothetical protein